MDVVDRKGEHMNEELITRIADALEGINSSLSEVAASLDKLEGCINSCISVGQAGHRLAVTGDISVD